MGIIEGIVEGHFFPLYFAVPGRLSLKVPVCPRFFPLKKVRWSGSNCDCMTAM
jgi:hypothetical protein